MVSLRELPTTYPQRLATQLSHTNTLCYSIRGLLHKFHNYILRLHKGLLAESADGHGTVAV